MPISQDNTHANNSLTIKYRKSNTSSFISTQTPLTAANYYGAQNEAYRREDARKVRKGVYNQRVRGAEAVRAD